MKINRFHAGALGLAAALSCAGTAFASTGPSSSDAPYVVPSRPGVVTKSVLTVGDSADGYRMVGVPDGLGAYDNGDGTFTLLSNHELRPTQGIERAHGGQGAFVLKWTKKVPFATPARSAIASTVVRHQPTSVTRSIAATSNRRLVSRV